MLTLIVGILSIVVGIAFGIVALALLRQRQALLDTLSLVTFLIEEYEKLGVAKVTKDVK